jgi:hypothetical protein
VRKSLVTAAANVGKVYAVTPDSTPFFRHGPQQGAGPDLTLPKDSLVRLIRPSFGYSKVEVLSSGQIGYVASEDINVASASLIATTHAAARHTASASRIAEPSGGRFNFDSADPSLMAPPEQLPAPDLPPTTSPSPGQ